MINEDELKKLLQQGKTPKAGKKAKDTALAAAMQEFDTAREEERRAADEQEHIENNLQGKAAEKRLKGESGQNRGNYHPLTLWRRFMKKRFIIGGTAGAVAACAVLVMLGGPTELYRQAMQPGLQSDAPLATDAADIKPYMIMAYDTPPTEAEALPVPSHADFSDATDAITTTASRMPSIVPRFLRGRAENAAPEYHLDHTSIRLPDYEGRSSAPRAEMEMQGRRSVAAPAVMDEPAASGLGATGLIMPPVPMPEPMPMPVPDDYVVVYQDEGRDRFKEFEDDSVKTVSAEPVSTFSASVDTLSYGFVRRMINNGVLPPRDAVRVEEMINYFPYDYALPESAEEPFLPNIAVYDSPWKAGNKIIHIGLKGYDLVLEERPRANLVFLIDTSGSMMPQDRLQLLVNGLKMLVEELHPEDTVGIVTYAGRAQVSLEPTKAAEKNKIINALDQLRASGSTAGGDGIQRAYKMAEQHFDENAVNRIILGTDGDFNVGISDPRQLKDFVTRKRETGIYLSVLGVGQGNFNDALMQGLAKHGNGQAAYIDTLAEARKVLVEQASSTLFPIADDVKIQVEFNPDLVYEYRLIGYENRALAREDFNNDAVDAGEVGAGHTVTALYEITPKSAPENRLIGNLRYGRAAETGRSEDEAQTAKEYAHLQIRYKLPGESTSRLLTRPITVYDEKSGDALPEDMRFAAAVAAFGQKLRGGRYLNNMSYDDIITLAQSGRGEDEFGYRAEFINLVRLAKSAAAMRPR